MAIDYSKVLVLLDNGHAESTPGKRSPLFEDGQTRLYEWKYNREIVKLVDKGLKEYGIGTYIVTPETKTDISLTTRANRVNAKVAEANKQGKRTMFISIHVNAAGNGQWMNAKGWSAYTTKGQNNSDKLANCLYEAAHEILDPLGIKIREDKHSDGDPDYESNFTVIKKANTVAVLTENFFMDNKEEATWLLTEEGKKTVAEIHIKGILKYIKTLK